MAKLSAAALNRLLGRGGWELVDVPAHAAAHPDSFGMPAAADLAQLRAGSTVRTIFTVLDQADEVRDGLAPYTKKGAPRLGSMSERMWSWVERVDGDALHCVLMNRPYASHTDLVEGTRFVLPRDHVIDLEIDPPAPMSASLQAMALVDEAEVRGTVDPARTPRIPPAQLATCTRAGVRPHRPYIFNQLLVSKNLDESSDPVYGARSEPRPERGDCGWSVWTGGDFAEVSDKYGFEVIRVQQITERHRRVYDYLALPPGSAFTLGRNGYEDLYEMT